MSKKQKNETSAKAPVKLTRAEKKEIQAVIRKYKGDGKPHSAQASIPYEAMYQDGVCRVTPRTFSKCIEFTDISYQLAQADTKTAIFENLCDLYNYLDASIHVQFSFINRKIDPKQYAKSFEIRAQGDDFDDIRSEYSDILQDQLVNGNNGLMKRKFMTYTIEADSLTEGAKATLGSGAAESAAQQVREDMGKTSSVLKDLIIRTAESVRSETQRVETELRSSYVAKSEFGAYQEQVDAKFTATAENVTQSIRYASELEGRLDEQAGDLQGLISYRTETKGYIRQGIVGYEDTVPIIGIAIGQDIQTTGTQSVDGKTYDVIDTSHNMSVWTSKKLSFYVEGTEIAYFSNGALHVGHVELDRITAAGKWDVSFSDGVAFKWIGG